MFGAGNSDGAPPVRGVALVVRSGRAAGYARDVSSVRVWLGLGFGVALVGIASAVGALHLPDWVHDKQSDYDQAAVLVIGAIVIAAAGYMWFAWRIRPSR